jgi:hypothetical protein
VLEKPKHVAEVIRQTSGKVKVLRMKININRTVIFQHASCKVVASLSPSYVIGINIAFSRGISLYQVF